MQCFSSGIPRNIFHESREFSRYTRKPLGKRVYQENATDKSDIPCYITRKRCLTIPYHVMLNTIANTSNATYARHMMGRLDVIPDWLYFYAQICIQTKSIHIISGY